MTEEFAVTDFDREIWASELEEFVPSRVFDAHAHVWHESCIGSAENAENLPAGWRAILHFNTGFAEIDAWNRQVFPGRELDFQLLGTPIPGCDFPACHAFIGAEALKSPHHIASTCAAPEVTADELDAAIRKYRFTGLKPYRVFAADPANCRITDYFPEALIEVADEHKLAVTLHMARFHGIADPVNLEDLRVLTAKYPHVRWILAHCARAFNAFTLEKSVFFLRDLPNIWYDTSAVCDVRSHYLLMKHENIERLMFGTDNIIAGGDHGKYVTWGRGWQFFAAGKQPHCVSDNTLVVYEQLRAQKQAADMAGLSQCDLEKLFHANAEKFFGIN